MATTLYLRGGGTFTVRRPWQADTLQHATSGQANGWLTETAGGLAASAVASTTGGPAEVLVGRYVTPALNADVTISADASYNLWGLESSMSANCSFTVKLYRLQPNGTVTLMGSDANTTEFGTSAAVRTGTISITSFNLVAGDCIGCEVYLSDAGGTMNGGFTGTLRIDGGTDGADGDSFITFSETLDFTTSSPGGSTLYFTDTASDLDAIGDTEKYLQVDGSAPSSFTKTFNTVNGPLGTTGLQMTDGGGGSPIRWQTAPLDAITTTGGRIELTLRGSVSNILANVSSWVGIYLANEDGSSAVLQGVFYFGGGAQGSSEWTATPTTYTAHGSLAPMTISQGQRLIVYIRCTELLFTSPVTFGTTTYLANQVSGHTFTLGVSDCKIVLRDTLTEETSGFTGSAAVTEGDDTSTASGTVVNPVFRANNAVTRGKRVRRYFRGSTARMPGLFVIVPITGTSTAGETADTSTASGTHTPPPITGTATPTEGDDTSTASGTFQQNITGTATPTEGDDTSTASGTFTTPLQMAFLLAHPGRRVRRRYRTSTVRQHGKITFHRGTSTAAETDDASTASGTFTPAPITGSSTATEGDDTSTGSGIFTFDTAGSATASEGDDTSTASGTFTIVSTPPARTHHRKTRGLVFR